MLLKEDISGFTITKEELNDDYLIIDYLFECNIDPHDAAASLCCEQSTAQWKRANVNEDFRVLYGAKFFDLTLLAKNKNSLYPETLGKGPFSLCTVKVAHPHRNFGPHLSNLISALAGEGPFYCPGITTIKLMDIQFPEIYLKQFPGPRYGLDALRKNLHIYDRPFFIGVIKPNLGLPIEVFSELAFESLSGGLDIAKDDEMLADPVWSPLKQRSSLCGHARIKAEQESGQRKVMLINVTDDTYRLLQHASDAQAGRANMVMVNPFATGLNALIELRRHTTLPIMGHFAGVAVSSRMKYFGVSSLVYTKLQRIAGCDLIGLSGFGARMHNTDDEVLANVAACLVDMPGIKKSLPIPGGSDHAGTLKSVYEKIGHCDFGFISGRGVFGHPQGPRAGAMSLRQAWESIAQEISLDDYAKHHEELKVALESFR